MIRAVQILILVLLAPMTLASAQSRDVYTIDGIPVDETAATVIEAQQRAFASAKLIGARQMIGRITLPEDRIAAPDMMIDLEAANLMAAAVDVEEETRGAGRYRGSLAVVFNPVAVRAFLDRNGVPYTDNQAALAVMIPVATPSQEYAWNSAWPDRSSGQLAPTVTSRTFGFLETADWTTLASEATYNGASRAVIARLSGSPGGYLVELTNVTAGGRELIGTTRPTRTLREAVEASSELLDTAWKRAAVVRETTRTEIEATVLYTSLLEWNTLRSALARSPLVSGFATKSVARDGAVVSFIFAGDGRRLISDLRDRGVAITRQDEIGYVLTSALTAGPIAATETE